MMALLRCLLLTIVTMLIGHPSGRREYNRHSGFVGPGSASAALMDVIFCIACIAPVDLHVHRPSPAMQHPTGDARRSADRKARASPARLRPLPHRNSCRTPSSESPCRPWPPDASRCRRRTNMSQLRWAGFAGTRLARSTGSMEFALCDAIPSSPDQRRQDAPETRPQPRPDK